MRTRTMLFGLFLGVVYNAAVLLADCSTRKCHEIRYFGVYHPNYGAPGAECREYQTNGGDALLAANTSAEDLQTNGTQTGGQQKNHPSISIRMRYWSACAADCRGDFQANADGSGGDFSEVVVTGTAGNYGPWAGALYCEPSA